MTSNHGDQPHSPPPAVARYLAVRLASRERHLARLRTTGRIIAWLRGGPPPPKQGPGSDGGIPPACLVVHAL